MNSPCSPSKVAGFSRDDARLGLEQEGRHGKRVVEEAAVELEVRFPLVPAPCEPAEQPGLARDLDLDAERADLTEAVHLGLGHDRFLALTPLAGRSHDLVERLEPERGEQLLEVVLRPEREGDVHEACQRDLPGPLEPLDRAQAHAGTLREGLLGHVLVQPAVPRPGRDRRQDIGGRKKG